MKTIMLIKNWWKENKEDIYLLLIAGLPIGVLLMIFGSLLTSSKHF